MKQKFLSLFIFSFLISPSFLLAESPHQPLENPWKMPLISDGKKVYFKWDQKEESIPGLNAKTVKPVGLEGSGIYLVDKRKVYFFDGFGSFRFERLKGANPKSFTPLPGWFAKDKKRVYYHQHRIRQADAKSFRPIILEKAEEDHAFEHIGHAYSKDKNHVFFQTKLIKGADVKTFQVLGANKAQDNYYHYQGAKMTAKRFCSQ